MADRRPLVVVSGVAREIATGDSVPATNGGTGQTSFAVGDLFYASTTTAISKLASVATGNVLRAGGVSTAPSWGKVALTTDVSGALLATNGGTGKSVYVVGDMLYASSTTLLSSLAAVVTGNALISAGTNAAPAWGKIGLTSHVSGTLPIANGGTNATSAAAALTSLGAQAALGYTPVNKAGDTMTGNLSISITNGGAQIVLSTSNMSTYNAAILGQDNGSTRWAMELGTGGAADFALSRFAGATFLNTPIRINYGTGDITLGGATLVGGTISPYGIISRRGSGGGAALANPYNFYWNGSGLEAWVDTTNIGTVSVTSDERVKRDIAPLVADRAAYLLIRPISFCYKDIGIFENSTECWGFSAQNLLTCIPKAVTGSPTAVLADGTPQPMGVQDRPILAQTVLQVQQLIAENEELRALITTLTARVDALSNPIGS